MDQVCGVPMIKFADNKIMMLIPKKISPGSFKSKK